MRICFAFIFCFLFARQVSAQPDIVKTQGITSPMHQANVGRIFFTSKYVPTNQIQQSDFLTQYRLTHKSDLFFTAFMDNSLTNYVHRIAPDLSADSLAGRSNFQFNLLVDGHLVYRSNLIPGAPVRAVRDSATVLARPLINNKNSDGLWTESFWGRFMHSGGDTALTDGRHLLRMEIRPYVNQANGTKTGDVIAAGDLLVNVSRKLKLDLSTIRLTPVKPYKGLTVSKEKFNRDEIKELKGTIDSGVFKKISGIVVLKNSRILIEEYFNGETRDSLHDPRSVGKSFSSTLTGIAIGDGYLKNEYQPLKDFYNFKSYANYSPLKSNTSLYDLLTMSSVFDGDDDNFTSPGNEENMYPTPNWLRFTLDLPVKPQRSKDQWHYFTAGLILLGDILNQTVPGGLETYADKRLFRPLGITDYHWQYTPQNVPNTAGGIRLKALDFAKYGQLYKNNGVWKGKQLVPKDWVAKTFTRQRALPGRPNENYGYLFWNKTFHVNGRNYETWYCAGNGGNSIFVFKDQPLVIVITAAAYGQIYAHPQVDKIMEAYILPAVIDRQP